MSNEYFTMQPERPRRRSNELNPQQIIEVRRRGPAIHKGLDGQVISPIDPGWNARFPTLPNGQPRPAIANQSPTVPQPQQQQEEAQFEEPQSAQPNQPRRPFRYTPHYDVGGKLLNPLPQPSNGNAQAGDSAYVSPANATWQTRFPALPNGEPRQPQGQGSELAYIPKNAASRMDDATLAKLAANRSAAQRGQPTSMPTPGGGVATIRAAQPNETLATSGRIVDETGDRTAQTMASVAASGNPEPAQRPRLDTAKQTALAQQYPELGKAGSPQNQAFVKEFGAGEQTAERAQAIADNLYTQSHSVSVAQSNPDFNTLGTGLMSKPIVAAPAPQNPDSFGLFQAPPQGMGAPTLNTGSNQKTTIGGGFSFNTPQQSSPGTVGNIAIGNPSGSLQPTSVASQKPQTIGGGVTISNTGVLADPKPNPGITITGPDWTRPDVTRPNNTTATASTPDAVGAAAKQQADEEEKKRQAAAAASKTNVTQSAPAKPSFSFA